MKMETKVQWSMKTLENLQLLSDSDPQLLDPRAETGDQPCDVSSSVLFGILR